MEKNSRGSMREAAVPLVCAVHCILTPMATPTLSVLGHNSGIEYGLLAVAFLMATTAYGVAWRHHRNHLVWFLGLLGFMIWMVSLEGSFLALSESRGSMVGSFVVAGTLLWNGHLRHKAVCGECICPIHRT
ncbi:MAG: hypothetical protein CME30_02520 [Gemmatimonadetes bacterium]|nr:hypothetical protein [Gemmatimonadota bacterium]